MKGKEMSILVTIVSFFCFLELVSKKGCFILFFSYFIFCFFLSKEKQNKTTQPKETSRYLGAKKWMEGEKKH
jgi:hypothetical protein